VTPNEPLVIPVRILAGDFAGWLRDAMAERRMSYRMVGMLAGVDHATIHRLASGDRLPSLATAVAIIRVFQRSEAMAMASNGNGHGNGHGKARMTFGTSPVGGAS
jgi:DNA-binding XRE family transcriptional regulator